MSSTTRTAPIPAHLGFPEDAAPGTATRSRPHKVTVTMLPGNEEITYVPARVAADLLAALRFYEGIGRACDEAALVSDRGERARAAIARAEAAR
jgi:hypothetical protein